MAVKIVTAVYINGVNRTSRTVLPIKIGNFLDERLDECNISLRAVKKEVFSPLTPVEVRVKITEYFGERDNPRYSKVIDELTLYFVVANDSANEMRPGIGLYNHELYCIEVTKAAECVVVDALTYTNDIGRSYTAASALAEPQWG